MADLVVVVGIIAFFAISALYVTGCERIIGSEAIETVTDPDATAREEIAAMAEDVR